MKTLYIAATAFQLITILNIRVNMDTPKGDLIIHEKSIPNSHYIRDRIIESGLFEKVFLFKDYDSRLNSVFTGQNGISDYLRIVYKKHISRMDINDFLVGEGYVDLNNVDEVFCFNKKFLNIVGKYDNIKINFIDEGVGSYTSGTINTSSKINKIYLYKPELAVYYEKYKEKFVTIPALDAKNVEFKNLLNKVWGYEEIANFDGEVVIGFDEPWKNTPTYFSYIPCLIKNSLLAKSKLYAKYAENEALRGCFIRTMCSLESSSRSVFIKMHPRSSDLQKKSYEDIGFDILKNVCIPWELVLYNLKAKAITLISVYSTASLSAFLYFENLDIDCKSVFLYKVALDDKNVNISIDLQRLITNVSELSRGVLVPQNPKELEECYNDV